MPDGSGGREHVAEGAVVEILDRRGERFAKVLVDGGAVLEVPATAIAIGVGDRVAIDASLQIAHLLAPTELARAERPPEALPPSPPDTPSAQDERPAARDYEHVLRMAALFAIGIVAFVAWRSWMVPRDFGEFGHYRSGAIAAAAARPSHYAGQAACIECHTDVQEVRATGHHAAVACEACHGPLGAHARGETDVAPVRPSPRAVCLTCHTARLGMPSAFPKIVVNEHSEAGPCTECHTAHAPGFSQTSSARESFRPSGHAAPPPVATGLLELAPLPPPRTRAN